ncbi:MAG: sugar phosphate nucleotidyltransferase [Oligoflexales bacterium]
MPDSFPLKGVILAAGFGSRMAPLTNTTPKPLLPLGEHFLIDLALQKLREVGVEKIAVNTHHLSQKLKLWADQQEGVSVFYEPKLLGTLGAFSPMTEWRGTSDLIVVNSDIYHSEPLTNFIAHYSREKPDILMSTRSPSHAGANPLWVQNDHTLIKIGGSQPKQTQPHSFACAQILNHRTLQSIPAGTQELATTYNQWLVAGKKINTLPSQGRWIDLGTPQDYYKAHFLRFHDSCNEWHHVPKGITEHIHALTLHGPSYISKDVLKKTNGTVGPGSIIYPGCQLSGSTVSQSLLLPKTFCKDAESIDNQIRCQNISIAL